MVVYENISETLVKAYSDQGMYIHGGVPEDDYESAVDPIDAGREYVETDRLIPVYDEEEG